MIEDALAQNDLLIKFWSGNAQQGEQLNSGSWLRGIAAAPNAAIYQTLLLGRTGIGVWYEDDDPNAAIVTLDTTSTRVIMRCNYQHWRGIPYTIVSAYPDGGF